jgi:small subunit ribosomal protein S1
MRKPRVSQPKEKVKVSLDGLKDLMSLSPEALADAMAGNMSTKRVELGDQISGRVTRVASEDVFVDLGGKNEGVLAKAEVPDVCVGDEVQAYVVDSVQGQVRLSQRLSGAAAESLLLTAAEAGTPVEGIFERAHRGGLDVRVGSKILFCPMSRASRFPVADAESLVGITALFRIIESEPKMVVDRRVIEEEAVEEERAQFLASATAGQAYTGRVVSIQPFGAFLDVHGAQGLLPAREMSWGPRVDPQAMFHTGQQVEVRLTEIDRDTGRLTFSLKDPAKDPWNQSGSSSAEGDILAGVVADAKPFGVFVDLDSGLTGLIPARMLGGRALNTGDRVDVRILERDDERKRLTLSLCSGDVAPIEAQDPISVRVLKVTHAGVEAQLPDGRLGWLPADEVDLPSNAILAQRYRVGKDTTVYLLHDDGRRATLTARDPKDREEGGWRTAAPEPTVGFGTFGDLLAAAKKS